MRKPFTDAPPNVHNAIVTTVAEDGPYAGVLLAFEHGFDFPPDLVRQHMPLTKRVAEVRATLGPAEAAMFVAHNADVVQQEELALKLSEARRPWAENTSIDDDRAAERERVAALQAAKRNEQIEARAAELQAAAEAKQRAKFMAQAAKELDNDPPPNAA